MKREEQESREKSAWREKIGRLLEQEGSLAQLERIYWFIVTQILG